MLYYLAPACRRSWFWAAVLMSTRQRFSVASGFRAARLNVSHQRTSHEVLLSERCGIWAQSTPFGVHSMEKNLVDSTSGRRRSKSALAALSRTFLGL